MLSTLRPCGPEDFEFDGLPLRFQDAEGHDIWRWVEFGMPKLGQYSWLLEFVCFLYETAEAARAGVNSGGTGFFVGVPSKRWPHERHHIHVVSNWHVTTGGPPPPYPVVRLNRRDGRIETINFLPDDWHYIPGGPDIAVSPPIYPLPQEHKVHAAAISMLLTTAEERENEVGAADDVFMVGRFVDYEGVEESAPAFRFGHISISDAKIRQLTGYEGRSVVVDMHSRSGFSGSPVFFYRTAGSMFFDGAKPGEQPSLITAGHQLQLLGVHYGQFPEEWELKQKIRASKSAPKHHQALLTEGAYVEGLSGMTCVAPAQDILNVLFKPELIAMREASEIQFEKTLNGRPLGPKPEKATLVGSGDANPRHKEDFTHLLNAAVKGKPSEGQT